MPDRKIVPTPEVLSFKDWLETNEFDCSLSLDLYNMHARRPTSCGTMGHCISGRLERLELKDVDKRPYDNRSVVAALRWKSPSGSRDSYKSYEFDASLAVNGENFAAIVATKEIKHSLVTYGVYKLEGFDEALAAARKLNSDCTGVQVARIATCKACDGCDEWDKSLVEIRPYETDENLLAAVEGHLPKETGFEEVCLTLLVVDLEKNLGLLKEIALKHIPKEVTFRYLKKSGQAQSKSDI